MPHKLSYTVVGSTGEADGFSARNLEEHSLTVTGWQTPQLCVYPQELVIRLREPSRLKKLQLLAHQYLIPTKVEFYIGGNDGARSFKRLGYIYLSRNEKTRFKSRELKSVHVDTEGTLLKLVLHKNHHNKFNLYNQVSIMALNIIGVTRSELKLFHMPVNHIIDCPRKNPNYISPMDDLAFDLYQDPEVARIIRRLDVQKTECVRAENFDAAKMIKQAIPELRKDGERLARYELEKRKAVENEDYDLAKTKKVQMEEYRQKVYQQLRNYGLVEEAGIPHYFEMETPRHLRQSYGRDDRYLAYQDERQSYCPMTPKMWSPVAGPSVGISPHRLEEDPTCSRISNTQYYKDPHPQEVPQKIFPGVTSPGDPATKVKTFYYDKLFSALSENRHLADEEDPPTGLQCQLPSIEPEPMSEKRISEASSVIDIFGLLLTSGAYSKTFSFREDALLVIYKILKDMPPYTSKEELKEYLQATIFILNRLVRDKVQSVFNASLQVLELLFTHFIPHHRLGKGELSFTVNQTLPKLILKTGDSQVRARQTTIDFIEKMASFSNVRATHIVPQAAVQPFSKETATRLAHSRVEIVSRLVKSLGLVAPVFSAESVMDFCMPALEHTSGAVRDAVCQVIYQVYCLARDEVKGRLPPDEPVTRKNMLYRNMFDEMDRIDGKPTRAELRALREREAKDEEREKQAEIVELQMQIEKLRHANAKISQPNQKEISKRPQQAAFPESQGADDDASSYLDCLCIFCGEHDEGFDNEGLDLHYWKHCPMLKRCENCKQVVEISTYNEHLLTECDDKDTFGKCNRCSETFPLTDLQKHNADKKCLINKPDKESKCPMCRKNIPFGEENWKSHLIGEARNACAENPRRVRALARLKAKSVTKPAPATNCFNSSEKASKQKFTT